MWEWLCNKRLPCKLWQLHNKKALRPALCSCCTVRSSFIRSPVLPNRALTQNSSSRVHTFSSIEKGQQDRQHFLQQLTFLSINLICREVGDIGGVVVERSHNQCFLDQILLCTWVEFIYLTIVIYYSVCWRNCNLACNLMIIPLGMNFSELLNIQKRDTPLVGPSFTNSWPSPSPHFPHRT